MKTLREILDEAIKDESHYTWHVYDHPESISLNYRGKEHPLHRGDQFGVRYARSSASNQRVVMRKHGINKVFSLPHEAAHFLKGRAKRI